MQYQMKGLYEKKAQGLLHKYTSSLHLKASHSHSKEKSISCNTTQLITRRQARVEGLTIFFIASDDSFFFLHVRKRIPSHPSQQT